MFVKQRQGAKIDSPLNCWPQCAERVFSDQIRDVLVQQDSPSIRSQKLPEAYDVSVCFLVSFFFFFFGEFEYQRD